MKRKLLFLILCLFTNMCFAISNITLYVLGEEFCKIENDIMYNDGDEIGKIVNGFIESEDIRVSEDDDYIYIKSNEKLLKFSIKNGYLVYCKDEKDIYIFYEDTGLLKRDEFYFEDDAILITEYFYDEKKNLIKEVYYDINNIIEDYIVYQYDKNTNVLINEKYYNNKNILEAETIYNKYTSEQSFYHEYDDSGNIVLKKVYDEITGQEIERHILDNKSNKMKILTFFKFDDKGKHHLEDGFYISNSNSYYYLKDMDDKEYIDWNEFYNAKIKKIKFNNNYEGFQQFTKFFENELINQSITLGSNNSDTFYCFNYTEEFTVNLSECYEISLIKKELDYIAMNKSGRNTGPFGIDIGMTYDEVKASCNGNEPEHIADDRYYITPKKSHPLFEKYIVWISEKYGVYYIKGLSEVITTTEDGTEVKNKFENIILTLERKYGKFERIDEIKPQYVINDSTQWMDTIKDDARMYCGVWKASDYENELIYFDGLNSIILYLDNVNSYSSNKAYIYIEYQFKNYSDAEEYIDDFL